MNFTTEQIKIINAPGNLCINAIAGSGKTTTILQYAANQPQKAKILYLAFNKSVKLEAKQKCKTLGLNNIQVETAHSLAFKHVIKAGDYKVSKKGYNTFELSKILNIEVRGDAYLKYLIANHISKFAAYFCNSTALKIQDLNYKAIITDKKAQTFVSNYYKIIENGTRQFLTKMERKEIDCTHDFYLKKFQLSNPVLNFDYILFDEGQDASPAMLGIFLNQKATKVIVGDTHQQIYAWRFATNSLEQVNFKQLDLTASFRFPPEIAQLAVHFLKWKKHIDFKQTIKIKGLSNPDPKQKASTKAIIARSNLGLLLKAIEYVVDNQKADKIYFEGNINSYTYAEDGTSLYDVLNLYLGKTHLIKDPLIKSMYSFENLEDYIEKTDDIQLAMMTRIVKEYEEAIPSILNEIKQKHINSDDKENAEVIFSTVHRSKGMEYDAVYLVNDFITEEKILKFSKPFIEENKAKINEEINLLYVAVTRAKNHLFIPETLLPINFKKSKHIHPVKVVEKPESVEDDNIEEITVDEVIQVMTGNTKATVSNKTVKAYNVVDVRKKHKQAYQPWTPQLDDELTVMYCENVPIKKIATHFGRTTGAINSRIKKLELRELYG